MAGLDPAIHAWLSAVFGRIHVDTRVKPAHDGSYKALISRYLFPDGL